MGLQICLKFPTEFFIVKWWIIYSILHYITLYAPTVGSCRTRLTWHHMNNLYMKLKKKKSIKKWFCSHVNFKVALGTGATLWNPNISGRGEGSGEEGGSWHDVSEWLRNTHVTLLMENEKMTLENCGNYCRLKDRLRVLGDLKGEIQTLSSKAISLHIVVCPFSERSTDSWERTCGHG